MNPGRFLISMGLFLILLGVLFLLFFRGEGPGRLPFDIVISRGNIRIYIFLGTSVLLSIILTLLFNILYNIGRK
ncbi:MAG TPA: DUF2905 domain-containing protein [candidate division WOR-3 bacterium]|uniref:DUF2905 domain-containing protein n=1 Tax=candidate division WOR-3 bacterium TaxID=2052148 RepID=A0A7C1BAR9_UNCW3|nr:DUF2905 domain-containing protein [candidate division WOR-3 bacterium]